ncbi:MAG: hydrogenase maturation protease [Demequinaceae bacterium]|nr:hydrogenase maturation protease [Demequinaceae bacterium]
MNTDAIIIGLGSPDRGDDAVGPIIAERLRNSLGHIIRVIIREDPTMLVHAWEGCRVAVLIDAVISGAAAGTISVRRAGTRDAPLPTHAFAAVGRGGSHAFGVAGAVELSRTLGTLPEHVAIVGVEVGTIAHGALSREVAASLDDAEATVYTELARAGVSTAHAN